MDEEKEKWVEAIFQSMKDSRRASPKPELLSKINKQIHFEQVDFVPFTKLRYGLVAAIFVLLVNSIALVYYVQNQQLNHKERTFMNVYNESLINSYQIY
ncbi:hypothetical protein [uncultured Aquimarina sp.]|uniref:hypothetical protein n=1 Tax=uncultured Aquimarina sp. TaxID=575652 RepID=UPI0026171784|nr:hypothetical protein [uncultured Aquimarina sp.]